MLAPHQHTNQMACLLNVQHFAESCPPIGQSVHFVSGYSWRMTGKQTDIIIKETSYTGVLGLCILWKWTYPVYLSYILFNLNVHQSVKILLIIPECEKIYFINYYFYDTFLIYCT
jgi:hypothetical protein